MIILPLHVIIDDEFKEDIYIKLNLFSIFLVSKMMLLSRCCLLYSLFESITLVMGDP